MGHGVDLESTPYISRFRSLQSRWLRTNGEAWHDMAGSPWSFINNVLEISEPGDPAIQASPLLVCPISG